MTSSNVKNIYFLLYLFIFLFAYHYSVFSFLSEQLLKQPPRFQTQAPLLANREKFLPELLSILMHPSVKDSQKEHYIQQQYILLVFKSEKIKQRKQTKPIDQTWCFEITYAFLFHYSHILTSAPILQICKKRSYLW